MNKRFARIPVSKAAPIELLEPRLMLSGNPFPADNGVLQPIGDPNNYLTQSLNKRQVGIILAQAASQALPGQVITITDREGFILGRVVVSGRARSDGVPLDKQDLIDESTARARTAAFFESTQNAFSSRSARFIIQDEYPDPVPNTPGGPLYGVEFSSIPGTDVLLPDQTNEAGDATTIPGGFTEQLGDISGDPGGIPLYIDGIPVGGIGVAGAGDGVAVRQDLGPILKGVNAGSYFGDTKVPSEETNNDEAVALAGAQGFQPNPEIEANNIFVGGIRLPYTAEGPRQVNGFSNLTDLVSAGRVRINVEPVSSQPAPFTNISFTIPGIGGAVTGQLKNLATAGEGTHPKDVFQQSYGVVAGASHKGEYLTVRNVEAAIKNAVKTALGIRGGIREPLGAPARVHVSVVDIHGDQLADFAMADGTIFSNDVAVQKARTALYFSDDKHAISTRAIGYLAQAHFPLDTTSAPPGPLYHLQNALSAVGSNGMAANFKGILRNGITIFPGGVPLYKNGVLVGAIGISGDGVDQDDMIAAGGATNFAAPTSIRSDALGDANIASFLAGKIEDLSNLGINANILSNDPGDLDVLGFQKVTVSNFVKNLEAGLEGVRLPYQKFPRNPSI